MDVSVVIPTRDRPQLLALTLQSALRQENVASEILVVDDGSERGTEMLLSGLASPRVRHLRNSGPAGVGGARNCGLAAAQGRWIAFLDDDDLWAPGKLARQIAAADASAARWAYAGDVSVDEALRVIDGSPPPSPERVVEQLHRHNSVPAGASNVIARRDLLETVGGFDPELRTSEDWDLWLRLAATGLPACVPSPLVALRVHMAMASRNVDRMLADIEVIARRHGIPVDRARHLRWAAWMSLQSGRRRAALRHYARAVRAGDVRSLARAVVAIVYPRTAKRHVGRDDSWAREAQGWLDTLRDASEDLVHCTRRR